MVPGKTAIRPELANVMLGQDDGDDTVQVVAVLTLTQGHPNPPDSLIDGRHR